MLKMYIAIATSIHVANTACAKNDLGITCVFHTCGKLLKWIADTVTTLRTFNACKSIIDNVV